MKNGIGFKNINEINFHPVLKDIENIFWFFILSNAVLANPKIQEEIKSQQEPNIISMLEKFNNWTSLQTRIDYSINRYQTTMQPLNQFILLGKTMAINLYELLKASDYYSNLQVMEEFRFLRYIRNGAAHNNKFNFKNRNGEWTLKNNEIIRWGDYTIDRNLQNKPVFNDFIGFQMIFILAKNFSERLTKIDNEQK